MFTTRLTLALFAVWLTVSASAAIFDAEGKPIPIGNLGTAKINWRPLEVSDEVSGVGILAHPYEGDLPDVCTVFLLDTAEPAGPAYLMTNAHCTLHMLSLKPLGVKEARVNQKTDFVATFRRLKGTPLSERLIFRMKEITYYTENGTDLALFRAEKPLGDFIGKGVRPLKLAKEKPKPGTKLRIVGAPLMRVPDEQHYLHVSDCKWIGEASLKNGKYFAPHSVIHHCSSIEGFSGSPLMNPTTKEVYLVNSHGAAGDSTDDKCTYASQPCEIDDKGNETVHVFRNYGQSLHGVAGCFDARGVFHLEQSTCLLPKP